MLAEDRLALHVLLDALTLHRNLRVVSKQMRHLRRIILFALFPLIQYCLEIVCTVSGIMQVCFSRGCLAF